MCVGDRHQDLLAQGFSTPVPEEPVLPSEVEDRLGVAFPGDALDADALLARDPSPGARQYIDLHERTIVSADPWGQLAIEFEIERLSITSGVRLIENVGAVCGEERVRSLSFLTDHIAVDEGHTVFNRRQLNRLLADQPALAVPLAAAGAAALDAHGRFIDDCVAVAR